LANTVTVEVSADTAKAEKNLGGLGGKVKGLAKPIAIGSAAATGFAMAAVKLGDEFKAAENTIAAGTGATGEALEALTKDFESVFANVPNDSQEVASAIADLNTELALEGVELQNASKAFLDVSRVMGEDMSPMIKAVSDSMVAFGVPASEVESQLDKLVTASQAVGVPMTKLSEQVVKFGPQLKEMGLSLDESTALFANMAAAGVETKAIMPGLSTAMQKMAKEGVEDMGLGLNDLFDSIKNATSETEAMALATDNFGAGAGVRFKDAIRSGALEFGPLLAAMEDSEGKVDALGESTLTTSDKMDVMKNKMKGALAPIGGMASSIGPLVIIIPGLTTAVSGMSAAMGALNLSMGPILIAVVAIAAAIAVAILVYKNWDKIWAALTATVDFFKDRFQIVMDFVSGAIESIKPKFEGLGDIVSAVFEGIWGAIKFYINLWIGAFNLLIKGMNLIKFDVPSWVPGLGGKGFGFNIPEIPTLAQGGIVRRPTLAMVGESGPEAVIPLSGSQSGAMSKTINVYLTGPTYGFDDFEDRVAEAIRDGARRGGFEGVLNTA